MGPVNGDEMTIDPVNLNEKLASIKALWQPKIVARLNDYDIKLARLEGEFIWHRHEQTDELFLVLDGTLRIQLRDGEVRLSAGELCVVPRGVEHCPITEGGPCSVVLLEPAGTRNTGDAGGERTAPDGEWV